MRYVRTSHYVEDSIGYLPSFIIVLQNDNNEGISYISNANVFLEMDQSNLEYLIRLYDCEEHIDKLLSSPIKSDSEITDAMFMFWKSKELTEIEVTLPNASDCFCFLRECPNLTSAKITLPKAKDCNSLLEDCKSLKEVILSVPNIVSYSLVFDGCRSLQRLKLEFSKDLNIEKFLKYCPLNKSDVEFLDKKALLLSIWGSLCKLIKN